MLPVIIGNALPILTLPIFTRIISISEYGVYTLALTYSIFVAGVSNFGLTVGYERNFFESKEKNKIAGLLYASILFTLSTFIFFGIITFIFKDYFALKIIGAKKYGSILFWSYFSYGLMSIKIYFLTYFKNTENAKAFVWYTIDETILGVLFSLFFVLRLKMGILGLILGQIFASSIILLILTRYFLKKLPFCIDLNSLKNSLKLSLPLTPRIFFGVINSQFDKYMIGLLGTLNGVGIYNLGQKIANVSFTFMTAIQNVFSPRVYKMMFDDGEDGKVSIGKYLTPFLYISISGSLFLSLFSEEIITLLLPKSYHEAINIISLLSLLYSTYFFGKQPQLVFAKKTGLISWITMVNIILNVLINIPMIKNWGYMGAVYGSLISGILSGILHFALSQKYYEIKWESKKIIFIYGTLFLFTFINIFLRNLEFSYILRLTLKISFLIFYLYIGFRFNIIQKKILYLFEI